VDMQEATFAVEEVRNSEETSTVGSQGLSGDESDKGEPEVSIAPTDEEDTDVADDATDVTPIARSRESFVLTEGDLDIVEEQKIAEDDGRKATAKQSNDSSKLWASAAVVGGLLVVGSLVLSRRSKR